MVKSCSWFLQPQTHLSLGIPASNTPPTGPPPSQGMLCFAEYFLEADGDQVLFDVSDGLIDGEYAACYYAHAESPARVTQVADSFAEWIENVCIQSFDDS